MISFEVFVSILITPNVWKKRLFNVGTMLLIGLLIGGGVAALSGSGIGFGIFCGALCALVIEGAWLYQQKKKQEKRHFDAGFIQNEHFSEYKDPKQAPSVGLPLTNKCSAHSSWMRFFGFSEKTQPNRHAVNDKTTRITHKHGVQP